jgi:TPR repeat protein
VAVGAAVSNSPPTAPNTTAASTTLSTADSCTSGGLFDDDDADSLFSTIPGSSRQKYNSLFDDDIKEVSSGSCTAPPEWKDVPGGAYAADEEVHSLSLKCRLSGSEKEAARLTGLAKSGNWYAEVCLAILQVDGAPHIPKDPDAASAFRAAGPSSTLKVIAKINNKYALYALGWFYINEGPHFNEEEGVRLYRLAAEQGNEVAQRGLGWWCEKGMHGLLQDKIEAVHWYRLASDAGLAAGQYHLAKCYFNGVGVEKDRVEGVRLYKLAAEQGLDKAQYQVGRSYAKGLGGLNKNSTKAVKYYEKAAAQGHETSIFELAQCYSNNTEGIQKKNLTPAARIDTMTKLYRQAADLGNIESMVRLGECYQQGEGFKKNYVKASEWFQIAATQGEHTVARFQLGICCLKLGGFGDESPSREAVEWFKLAAKDGYDPAYYELGLCYQNGVGVDQDHAEAEKWYIRKCESDIGIGSNDARARIKEMQKAAKGEKSGSSKGGLFGFGLFK